MKHKLIFAALSVVLLFATACNKEEQTPAATPTPVPTATATPSPTPTPTPLPENLAITALQNLSGALDFFQNYFPKDTVDYSNGIGYDISMELTSNRELMDAIGLEEVQSLRLDGTMDIHELLAANCTLSLNDTKLLTAHLFTDFETLLFNLPDYSEQYASYTLTELINSSEDGAVEWFEENNTPITELLPTGTGQLVLTNTNEYDSVAFGNDKLDFLLTNLKELLKCFHPQDGIEENITIGTGSYTVTGKQYTACASATELQNVINTLANDYRTPSTLREELQNLSLDNFTKLYLFYYKGDNTSYAWELVSNAADTEPVIFVSTPEGFCLYSEAADGTEDIFLYSESTGPMEGIITIPDDEDSTDNITIEYEFLDTYFSIELINSEFSFSMDYLLNGGKMKYDITFSSDNYAVLIETDGTPEQASTNITLSSFGQKLLGLDMTTTLRDYYDIPMPKNYVDADTWLEGLDLTAMEADIENFKSTFPVLAALFSGDEEEDGESNSETGSDALVAYPNAFMNMTGYSVDEYGNVDFDPLEEEVFAMGEPSTTIDTIPITEETMTELFTYAACAYTNMDYDLDYSFNVSGNIYENDVNSTYLLNCYYYDTEQPDNTTWFLFDAITEELGAIYVDHVSMDEALHMLNDLLDILGYDYTVTVADVENDSYIDNLYFTSTQKDGFVRVGVLIIE